MDYLRWALRYGYYGRDEDAEIAKQKIEKETRRLGNERIRRMAMSTAERLQQEGKLSLLYTLMTSKFGNVPDAIQLHFSRADNQTLHRFAADFLQMDSLDEVEKWWNQNETSH
jgi:hypothetical protein